MLRRYLIAALICTTPYPSGAFVRGGLKGTLPSAGQVVCGKTFPDATTTGNRIASGSLVTHNGDLSSTSNGQTISGLHVVGGTINIVHNNVTVQDNTISGISGTSVSGVQAISGTTGGLIDHNTITGADVGVTTSDTISITNNDISGMENGVNFFAFNGVTLVQGNYMHDFGQTGGGHFDGVEIDGNNSNITINSNTIIIGDTQTSPIQINNSVGSVSNVSVNANYLKDGSYAIYVDGHFRTSPFSNITITGNVVGVGSSTGYYNFNTCNVGGGSCPTPTGNLNLSCTPQNSG